jgi:hypothetical protein
MTDLYLIAHKVRNEPTFDIAIKMICPECNGQTCDECDNGFYWIIPTSGHRAYPYWHHEIRLIEGSLSITVESNSAGISFYIGDAPADLPDHYTVRASPSASKRSLLAELGLAKPTGHPSIQGKVTRRI